MQPYSDDYMMFDELSGHYRLTENALRAKAGINLRARLEGSTTVSADIVITQLLELVSDMIYAYIHQHAVDNSAQDTVIAQLGSARAIIQKAMIYQAIYLMNVGNLYYSTKPEERAMAIDELAKNVLNTTVPELGHSLLYTGWV